MKPDMPKHELTDAFSITAELAKTEPMDSNSRCHYCQYPLNYNTMIGPVLIEHGPGCLWWKAGEFVRWLRTLG